MIRPLSLLLHLYIGLRLLPALRDQPLVLGLLAVSLAATLFLLPMGIGLAPRPPPDSRRMWAGWIGMGLFSSLFVLTLLRDLLLLGARGVEAAAPGTFTGAGLTYYTALAVPLLAAAITAWGWFNARGVARVRKVDVPVANLPSALEGFRIAQISDIHVGPTIRGEYLGRIVRAVNHLDADVVAVTGDLVDGTVADLAPHVAPLAELRSRHGTFFVTGNHEYYSGVGPWIAELRRLGLTVLLNSHVVLRHARDGHDAPAPLVLAGVTDYTAGQFEPSHRSDPRLAMAGAPPDAGARVLLAHQPRSAPAAAEAGFDLQVSGHTHGGQFMPWNFFVRLQQPYVHGLRRLGGLWVYISRGTGYWGPPMRIGAPSEITLLRLVRPR